LKDCIKFVPAEVFKFVTMSLLFSSLKLRELQLKNRIAVSPMCQYSSRDGYVNDWHMVHYGSRAVGGAGLVIQEATAILPEGRITPGDLGIWHDDFIPGLRKITEFIHNNGSIAGIQLAHAGRKASCAVPREGGKQLDLTQGGWHTVGPSALPFQEAERIPQTLREKDILHIVDSFKIAAHRALQAGYKVAEIHSAHGYLLFEFLSPLSNHRTDMFGGSFENRIRFLLLVAEEVRTVWPPENPLFVRLSCSEWTDGGWTLDESVKLAALLKNKGIDLVDCSSGGNLPNAIIPFGPGYQVAFSAAVRKTGISTGAVGMITDAQQAESILQQEQADLILMGRELLRNPYFPLRAAQILNEEISWPIQYIRSKPPAH
jgi:2,4-dienoyl-CoA reductase-like NADH-dependent reductase (Old Yellow Enzyme family)